MAKLVKKAVFAPVGARKETSLDKTTRIARKITEDETEARQAKIKRLRNARIEYQAETTVNKDRS